MRFELRPVAPFRLDLTAWTLRRDPANTIDRWDGREYRRVVLLDDRPAELALRQTGPMERPHLAVEIKGARPGAKLQSLAAALLDRLLGLSLDLAEFHQWVNRQPRLCILGRQFHGLHPPRFPTVWEAAVNAISCQQLSAGRG
jgi:DNA-3-methyladenine glycosylase II